MSLFRRAGAKIAKFIESAVDPAQIANRILLYGKDVAGITELFSRASDGTISQLTPVAPPASPSVSGAALGFFGDGSDGDVVLGAGTTTLVKDMFYNNLTIAFGDTLETGGFVVHVKGTLSVEGTITRRGGPGGNATLGPLAGGTAGTGYLAAGSLNSTSSDGGTGSAASSSGGTVGINPTYPGNVARGGKGGDAPPTGFNNPASVGPLTPWTAVNGDFRVLPWAMKALSSGGTSGVGSRVNTASGGTGGAGAQFTNQAAGGGGGGGGGYVVVSARLITGVGLITVEGGFGGNAVQMDGVSNGGGGGGGGGGVLVLVTNSTVITPTTIVTGGFGGFGIGPQGLAGDPGGPGLLLAFLGT